MTIDEVLNISELDLRGKTVLVTGSSGYVGKVLCNYLRLIGCHVVGVDKQPDNENILEYSFNLVSAEKLNALIKRYKPDIVFHTGTNSALHYKNSFHESFNEDYSALSNILNALDNRTKIIFYSSSYVYSGKSAPHPLTEVHTSNPEHNFGVGKLFLEQLLRRLHKNSVVFRMSSVFGEGQPRSPNAIKTLIDESISNKTITIWGDGSRMMQYVFMDDVISSSILVPKITPGIFNLASEDYLTLNDVSSLISNHFNSTVIHDYDKSSGETLPALSVNKLKHEVGIDPTPVINGLNKYLGTCY